MLRTLLVPAMLVGIVATPFLLPDGNQTRVSSVPQLPASQALPSNYGYPQPVQVNSVRGQQSPFRQASQQRFVQGQPNGLAQNGLVQNGLAQNGLVQNGLVQNGLVQNGLVRNGVGLPQGGSATRLTVPAQQTGFVQNPGFSQPAVLGQPAVFGQPPIAGQPFNGLSAAHSDWGGPIYDENNNLIGMVPGNGGGGFDPALTGMTPDFAASQTFSYGGNASGPDFSAPMQFTPVMNFEEIFSYDVTAASISQRWDRVSNVPVADGLHGKRVALVTGTNSWDLHGSLTYYFDQYQKCRRITFRGWAGDPSRLIEYLQTQYGLKSQPTNEAGFYLAKNRRKAISAMLMKSPPTTYSENKVEQIGVLLELNDANSKNVLSQDFVSLIRGSQQTN